MQFTTPIDISPAPFSICLTDRIAMLGSCFTDNIARKMGEYYLSVKSNPTGTLYNPVSIAHHLNDPFVQQADILIITFGTAWVYVDKQTNEVVDNCQKRPASDFIRRRLTVDEITNLWLPILEQYADKRFIFTVSPIRHIKDGLHDNQLSKSTLLLAIDLLAEKALCTQGLHNRFRFWLSLSLSLTPRWFIVSGDSPAFLLRHR